MTIQTKYNIGQNVWIVTIVNGTVKAKEVEVLGFSIQKWYQDKEVEVNYSLFLNGEEQIMNESLLFETKEKLAESIINP